MSAMSTPPGAPALPPFLRAPETARSIFVVMLVAACGPLAAGIVFFGWRAAMIAALSVGGCLVCQLGYARIVRSPMLERRSHAVLLGVLLALTLPPWAPWYVPLVAAAFATIVGKAIFGGVGHYLWQPALVGRLAVAVLFAGPLAAPMEKHPQALPMLAPNHLILGDVLEARRVSDNQPWGETFLPGDAHAASIRPTTAILAPLTRGDTPAFSALMDVPVPQETDALDHAAAEGIPNAKPAALMKVPPIEDLIFGSRPGGIGETCIPAILIAGLYLIYRNYVRWVLPVTFLLAAAAVAAFGPIQLAGGDGAVWGWGPAGGWCPANWGASEWTLPPLLREGFAVGTLYVMYQLLGGAVLLTAFFLATEMTSRPITAGGQAIFGLGGGAIAMTLQLYTDSPIPAYMAVLAMNTVTPFIDARWRPRVFGRRRWGGRRA